MKLSTTIIVLLGITMLAIGVSAQIGNNLRNTPFKGGPGKFDGASGDHKDKDNKNWGGMKGHDDSKFGAGKDKDNKFGGHDNKLGDYKGHDNKFGGNKGYDNKFGDYKGHDNKFGGHDNKFGDYKGHDNKFGDYKGHDNKFGDYKGHDNKFGDYKGHDNKFGGHDNKFGDYKGHDNKFGDYKGHDNKFGGKHYDNDHKNYGNNDCDIYGRPIYKDDCRDNYCNDKRDDCDNFGGPTKVIQGNLAACGSLAIDKRDDCGDHKSIDVKGKLKAAASLILGH